MVALDLTQWQEVHKFKEGSDFDLAPPKAHNFLKDTQVTDLRLETTNLCCREYLFPYCPLLIPAAISYFDH